MFGPVGSAPIGGFWSSSSAVTQTLTPSRFDNTSVFYSPSVSIGVIGISPGFFENESAFFPSEITTGPVYLTPSRFDNTSIFYGPRVARYVIPWIVDPHETNAWTNRARSGNWVIHPIADVDWTEQ